MSKLAIHGDTIKDGVLNPLRDATRGHTPESRPVIDSWFTLGSPLGREGVCALDLGQMASTWNSASLVACGPGPTCSTREDPVAANSWFLPADENVRADVS